MRLPHAVSMQSIIPDSKAASPALRPEDEPRIVIELIFPMRRVYSRLGVVLASRLGGDLWLNEGQVGLAFGTSRRKRLFSD